MELNRTVKEMPLYDTVVCGGGPAGIAAAVASARSGLKTLLIESNGCLGGISTAGALPFYLGAFGGSIPFPQMIKRGIQYNSLDRSFKAVGGIFNDMVNRLKSQNAAAGPAAVAQSDSYAALDRFGCHDELTFDIEAGKRIFDEMAADCGLEVLYYTQFIAANRNGDIIDGVYIANKDGISFVPCRRVIDCTGDADVVADAGFETYKGDKLTGEMTHAGLVCHIENIDSAAISAYLENGGDPWFKEICARAIVENPDEDIPERLIIFPMVQDGVYMINGGTSKFGIDGTKAADRTALTIWGRRRARLLTELLFKKYIPGGKNARLRLTAYYPGIRETRRIVGEKTLSEELILKPENPQDIIAVAGRHFDLSKRGGNKDKLSQPFAEKKLPFGAVGIPYGSLIPKGSHNIITAGRCIAADGQALGPARVMATCMATGEAAGTAAAMTVEQNCCFNQLDVQELRERLRKSGAVVDLRTED